MLRRPRTDARAPGTPSAWAAATVGAVAGLVVVLAIVRACVAPEAEDGPESTWSVLASTFLAGMLWPFLTLGLYTRQAVKRRLLRVSTLCTALFAATVGLDAVGYLYNPPSARSVDVDVPLALLAVVALASPVNVFMVQKAVKIQASAVVAAEALFWWIGAGAFLCDLLPRVLWRVVPGVASPSVAAVVMATWQLVRFVGPVTRVITEMRLFCLRARVATADADAAVSKGREASTDVDAAVFKDRALLASQTTFMLSRLATVGIEVAAMFAVELRGDTAIAEALPFVYSLYLVACVLAWHAMTSFATVTRDEREVLQAAAERSAAVQREMRAKLHAQHAELLSKEATAQARQKFLRCVLRGREEGGR